LGFVGIFEFTCYNHFSDGEEVKLGDLLKLHQSSTFVTISQKKNKNFLEEKTCYEIKSCGF
jgi:hypothetical protein